MAQRVRKHLPTLRILALSTPPVRKQILKSADDGLIKLLVECCYNTLYGGVKLTPAKVAKLKKFKTVIRKIAKPNKNLNNKKKVLVQSGSGLLSVLLPTVITELAALLGNRE
jgi:hypothetical protein